MSHSTDQQLLQEYTERRSDTAFTELVQRHIDLVYSAALRMVRDPHLAGDVTQGAFVALANNAPKLVDIPALEGWLHGTTRNLAANVVRTEVRRRNREQEAALMNEMLSTGTEANWENIAPHLDEALSELSPPERDALMLRYFKNLDFHTVGAQLGVSDDAAQKRVSRAVERLREFFAKRGVSVGAGGLVVVISANAVQAAPVGLAVTISAAALAGTAATTSTLIAATTKTIAMTALQKAIVAGLMLAGAAALIAYLFSNRSNPEMSAKTLSNNEHSFAVESQVAGRADQNDDDAATQAEPDPVKLLRTVMKARAKIRSGTMEFEYFLERFDKGGKETNQFQFAARFDGEKLRFESIGREFAYTYDADEDKQNNIIQRAASMSKQAAVKAGLLDEFSSHHTLVRDGKVLYDFWQAGNQKPRAVIDDVGKGTGNYIFDPRCIGLTTSLGVDDSLEGCLGGKQARFVGEENLDGFPAFHVRIEFDGGGALDYWVDKERPERLIQQTYGLDIVKSKYDELNLDDPIPVEVSTMSFRNGMLASNSRLMRSKAIYNVPVDPTNFSLAGLGMPVGTDVSDDRIHRMLGYWDGFGLSPNLPKANELGSTNSPKLSDRLASFDNAPASTEALENAVWTILNTPDGPAVQKAAEVVLQFHTADTNLLLLCQGLERLRPRCATNLLTAILQDNPSVEIQGNACFALATILKSEAKYGTNLLATAQAVKQFERVIRDFSMVKQRGYSLADLARPELYELQRLIIGKPAPETMGEDLNGQPMKLSDYRGKVVVLVFWSGFNLSVEDNNSYSKLLESMGGKPFALIGVHSEWDRAKPLEVVQKFGVTWPSFHDDRDGPIAKLWNSRCWPDIWVLDGKGIIRHRGLAAYDLKNTVDKLLAE